MKSKRVKVLVTLKAPDNAGDWLTYVRLALIGMMIPVIKVEEYPPLPAKRKK